MLHLQELLRTEGGLRSVQESLGINVYYHPTKPLVGFKYSQIDSPKTDPVVRECRGIVLERDTWNLVARGFQRFFNAGEVIEEFQRFDWSNFHCNSKEDGSLLIVYHYDGEWHVNTSGSFGLGEVQFSDRTWRELFWETLRNYTTTPVLTEGYTYVFELCTPYNKVVRTYPRSQVFLLSMFEGEDEVDTATADVAAAMLNVPRPETYNFRSQDEIKAFLYEKEQTDPTYEGVIVRDRNNLRFKMKTQTYVAYHHLHDNGNLFNPKRLVPLLLAGERDELLAYFGEQSDRINEVDEKIRTHWEGLLDRWRRHWRIADQKAFALAVARFPFSGTLFAIRQRYGENQTEELLRQEWTSHPERIVKALFG